MMAVNRHRLRHRAQRGARGAKLALALLAQTDKLLGVILLGNTLVNAAAATLTAVITKRLFGEGELALALGTVAITFAILVFSEITPKVVGAAHADRIAPVGELSCSRRCCRLAYPVVWFVNLFVQGLLQAAAHQARRRVAARRCRRRRCAALVLEGQYFRGKHRAMLANLLDLEAVTRRRRDDAAQPDPRARPRREAGAARAAARDLATTRGCRSYEDALDNIVGIAAPEAGRARCSRPARSTPSSCARSCARPTSFRPARRCSTQLQQFQADRAAAGARRRRVRRAAGPGHDRGHRRGDHRRVHDAGARAAPRRVRRERRRQRRRRRHGAAAHAQPQARHRSFPLEGPKTLNGLIVEQLGEIPDAGTQFPARRPGGRNPADAGPRGQGRPAAAPGRARAGAAFTKPAAEQASSIS